MSDKVRRRAGAWSTPSRKPRAAARASSSPRWARTATTAARRSSPPPLPISASTSISARCSQTPDEAARQAVENDVHIVGVSSLAAGHLTLVPELKAALKKQGRDDIMIVVGGVMPPQDYDALIEAGAEAIFPPGTVIAEAAEELIRKLNARLGHSEAAE